MRLKSTETQHGGIINMTQQTKFVLCTIVLILADLTGRTEPVPEKKEDVKRRAPAVSFAHGTLQSMDLKLGTVDVLLRDKSGKIKKFNLAERDVQVTSDVGKPPRFEDIPPKTLLLLRLSAGEDVVGVHAIGPTTSGRIKSVDTEKRTITLADEAEGKDSSGKTLPVTDNPRIMVDGRFVAFADLPIGKQAVLKLTLDGSSIAGVQIINRTRTESIDENTPIQGTLKGFDLAKGTLTVLVQEDGKTAEKTFDTVLNVITSLVDGKSNNLGDLLEGMKITLWMSVSKKSVGRLKVEPTFEGILRKVDAEKGIISVEVDKDQTVKTFSIDKNARIAINGWPSEVQDFEPGWHVKIVPSRKGDAIVALWTLQPDPLK